MTMDAPQVSPRSLAPDAELELLRRENERLRRREAELVDYLRQKIDDLLRLMGTLPLHADEIDDEHMITFDPIGIITASFAGILENLRDLNSQLTLARDEIATIFEVAGAGILVLDPQRRILSYNRKVAEQFDFVGKDALGGRCDELLCHNQVDVANCVFCKVTATGEAAQTYAWQFGERYFDVLGAPIKQGDGTLIQVVIVYLEVTERITAEKELKAALNRVDSIVQSVSEGLLVIDPSGCISMANPAAEQLLGAPQWQMIGHPLRSYLDAEELVEAVGKALRDNVSTPPFDVAVQDANPLHSRCFQARIALLRDFDNRARGVVLSLRDVTRERLVERMKTDFISTAAHELRTPLSTILGYSELLLDREVFTAEEQHEFLELIHGRAEALSQLIDDILDISRIESGMAISLEVKPLLLAEQVKKVVEFFRRGAPRHDFQVVTDVETLQVLADPIRLGQILDNLLSNAVKYSPEGGRIQVELAASGRVCQVRIHDEGIGMTPEQATKIFDKFYRADASNTAVTGTGLGMTIVRELVRAHGGEVEVASLPGRGTTISFTLPLA